MISKGHAIIYVIVFVAYYFEMSTEVFVIVYSFVYIDDLAGFSVNNGEQEKGRRGEISFRQS